MIKTIKTTLLVFLSMTLMACVTSPLTGRKGTQLVSNAEIFPAAFSQYQQVLQQSKVDNTSENATVVKRVGQRIALAAQQFYSDNGMANSLNGYEWEFNLIESKELNAWCMPGGKVAVYSGILPICKDETGLAVVLGHEITHALNGHSAEQMSNAMLAQYGGQIVSGTINNSQWKSIFNDYYPIGAQIGMLKFGRGMELDADKGGLLLMAMAGYDPREAIPFWERMENASSGNQAPPEFLSTHPNPGNRIAQIQELMPQAIELYNASPYKDQFK